MLVILLFIFFSCSIVRTIIFTALDLFKRFLLFRLFLAHEYVFLDGGHKSLVLTHLLQCLPDILQKQETWVICVELEELSKVGVLFILGADALFFEYEEEVFCLEEGHCEVLGLCLHVLFEDNIFEELLRRHVKLKKVDHQHDHDLNGLLIQL